MPSKVAEIVRVSVDRLPAGFVFTYEDIIPEVKTKEAVIKSLNRLVQSGRIAKLSKGRYYKPEKTPFGVLMPPQEQVVKDLLMENGKIVGYLTGLSIYNRLGLTTQVGNTIEVGRNDVRPNFQRERYNIKIVRQKNIITKENFPLLQLLDVLRYIKKIPDTTPKQSVKRMTTVIAEHTKDELKSMVRLAMKYPPSTRALFGGILDEIGEGEVAKPLLNSLNPITKYETNGIAGVLSQSAKWNLK